MKKSNRHVSKHEAKAFEGKCVGYDEIDKGHLIFLPNSSKLMAV